MKDTRDLIAAAIMAQFCHDLTIEEDHFDVLAKRAVQATDALLTELHPKKPSKPPSIWAEETGEDGAVFYVADVGGTKAALFHTYDCYPDVKDPCYWELFLTYPFNKDKDTSIRFSSNSLRAAQGYALNEVILDRNRR